MMIRTQIYLPKALKYQAEKLAEEKNVPLAEIIRQALKKVVEAESLPKENPLFHMAKLKIKGGPKDLSSKFDEYLYGGK